MVGWLVRVGKVVGWLVGWLVRVCKVGCVWVEG